MPGRVQGKVAFITGAARGQGRSHAIRLAQEGADIIAVDICAQISSVSYAMSTPDDLAQTVKEVEAAGRRIVARQADVRDVEGLRSALADGIAELGVPTIVLANAGIGVGGPNSSDQDWHDVIAVNLTGVWNTGRIAIPAMIEAGRGGSIVLTSSTAGLRAIPNAAHYVAAKHGVVGLTRTAALEFAQKNIRVNCVCPGVIRTPMVERALDSGGLTEADVIAAEPVGRLGKPEEIAEGVLWLLSDAASFVTGHPLTIDGGWVAR